jgi:hypothetical protein
MVCVERSESEGDGITISEAERVVCKVYPWAFVFCNEASSDNAWSICTGYRCISGDISIPGVGWHDTITAAWLKAAEVVMAAKGKGRA